MRFFVTCAKGLEALVAEELQGPRIRAKNPQAGASGVSFVGDWGTAYRANLWLRSGIRVLVEFGTARVASPEELYEWACSLPWRRFLSLEQTFSVEARVRDSEITHSKYAALRVKDALCDVFRKKGGKRPSVDVHGADLPLFLSLYKNRATLYRDMSGVSLHKRGYRDALHKSNLNTAVAAGILIRSGLGNRGAYHFVEMRDDIVLGFYGASLGEADNVQKDIFAGYGFGGHATSPLRLTARDGSIF